MKEVVLNRISESGKPLKAVFLPENGMNLKSFTLGDIEAIDQSTLPLFEERMAGLGALIGPHFYHRKENSIPKVPDETIFPHIQRVKASGSNEPFSHGIARYVPWNWTASDTTIEATVSGMDTVSGITLAALEGFDFKMKYKAHLTSKGLEIDMHVESEKSPSIAGLHYYYALDDNSGRVEMECQDEYNDMGTWRSIPDDWRGENRRNLNFNLLNESDFGFLPGNDTHTGRAKLVTKNHSLTISYETDSEENAFQLYHPKDASYVCIEPVTAKNPRDAKQLKNHLKVRIEIE